MVQTQNLKLVQLYQTAALGSKDKNHAFEQLLASNMGLLGFLVKKTYRNKEKISFDELMQCACVGLYNAAEKYNSEKGVGFSSYAYGVIRNYLNEEVRNSDLVPVSLYLRKKGHKRNEMSCYDDDFHSVSSYSDCSDYLSEPEMACLLNEMHSRIISL